MNTATTRYWFWAGATLLLIWTAIVLMLEPAGSSMRKVWDSSETYTHGYVILPIAAWLVWRRRKDIPLTPVQPDFWALLPAVAVGFVWLAGRAVGAQVVEHYALVSLLIIAFWTLFGRAQVRLLTFPLFYLLLMVPAGDSLIEPMIHFTADFTVAAVRLFGIPVLQEGTFLTLPTGQWSVVEACSGIRYFLSSIVLGWLFAYLTYRTWWKRLAFGVASIVVPVLANGLRATIIVLLGHYSGMTVAVGVDHLIYGWVWFGIVMLLMFWVGNIWREDDDESSTSSARGATSQPRLKFAAPVALLAVVAIFPFYEHQLSSAPPAPSPLARWAPVNGWAIETAGFTEWQPRWLGMDDKRSLTLQKEDAQVMLFVGWYGAQRQGSELINSLNILVPEQHPIWRNLFENSSNVDLQGNVLSVRQALLHAPSIDQRLLVWHWRYIDGEAGNNMFSAKLRLALSKLGGRGDAASGVLIAAPYQENAAEAEKVLKAFLQDNFLSLNQTLDSGIAP